MSSLEKIVLLKLNGTRKNPILPKELESEVAKRIGSEFRPGTRDCIRGLDPVQERVLLPAILGLQPQDAAFPQKARDHWADISITPTKEGLRLNVATMKEKTTINGEEVDYELPVAPDDYMTYKIACQSSKVASTPEQLKNPSEYDFILIDLSEQKKQEEDTYKVKKEATLAFARLVSSGESSEDKIDWLIHMLKPQEEHFNFEVPLTEKEIYLDKKLDQDPSEFLKKFNDPNLETKALLKKAISGSQVTIEGENYFLGETNLGPIRSAVEWLKAPENSAKVVALKSRLENALKNTKQ